MPVLLRASRYTRASRRSGVRLRLEPLESRDLMSVALLNQPPEPYPNDTLTEAEVLQAPVGRITVSGMIGDSPAGATDVDWYTFTLTDPTRVKLALGTTTDSFSGVLSLYNNDQPYADPFNPTGHRLLGQSSPDADVGAGLDRSLAPGTYFVAVSGAGNAYFHPFLAGSGYPGDTGNYRLTLALAALPDIGTAPAVITAEPAADGTLAQSPAEIRVTFSADLDTATILPNQTVVLTYHPTGAFGDGNDLFVEVNVTFSTDAKELQLIPLAPLDIGFYRLTLAGDTTGGQPVLQGLDGSPLGQSLGHLDGADFTMTFQVSGREGTIGTGVPANDTPAGAQDLGELTENTLVQATGSIGDDPAYNFLAADPALMNPAADVDMYRFHITGPGRYAFTAEVFANRIGSSLDAAVSLFRLDPVSGSLVFVGSNDLTFNLSTATDGSYPLYNDPVLFAGLTEGDYYLVVSGTGNLPDSSFGQEVGVNGVFDPATSHSGSNGYSTGWYVLNLSVQADSTPPQVTAVTPADGTALQAPLTSVVVQFSELVNFQQLAYQTSLQMSQGQLDAVFVLGNDGTVYHPRFVSFDPTTYRATFLMTDALPGGTYELHFAGNGPFGITDLAGNPLAGTDPVTGDYVIRFTESFPERGTDGDPLLWTWENTEDGPTDPQVLGTLFPAELQAGVVVKRSADAGNDSPTDQADYYQFTVLQDRDYILSLLGVGFPKGTRPVITDAAGLPVDSIPQGSGGAIRANLAAGTYTVRVGGWQPSQAGSVAYQLRISLGFSGDNPTPLTTGPAPAVRLRLVSSTVPTVPTVPTDPVLPPPIVPVVITPTLPDTTPVVSLPGRSEGDTPTVTVPVLFTAVVSEVANGSGTGNVAALPRVQADTFGFLLARETDSFSGPNLSPAQRSLLNPAASQDRLVLVSPNNLRDSYLQLIALTSGSFDEGSESLRNMGEPVVPIEVCSNHVLDQLFSAPLPLPGSPARVEEILPEEEEFDPQEQDQAALLGTAIEQGIGWQAWAEALVAATGLFLPRLDRRRPDRPFAALRPRTVRDQRVD